jgi:hypothetical protein
MRVCFVEYDAGHCLDVLEGQRLWFPSWQCGLQVGTFRDNHLSLQGKKVIAPCRTASLPLKLPFIL